MAAIKHIRNWRLQHSYYSQFITASSRDRTDDDTGGNRIHFLPSRLYVSVTVQVRTSQLFRQERF